MRPRPNSSLAVAIAVAVVFLLALSACGDDGPQEGCLGASCDGFVGDGGERGDEGEGVEEAPDEFVVSWESLEERPCPDDNALTFSNFGRGFMLSWCTGCHSSALVGEERAGAPEGTDFDRLPVIEAFAERIWARSADDNLTMPPVSGPGAQERFLLGQWLACGAPQ